MFNINVYPCSLAEAMSYDMQPVGIMDMGIYVQCLKGVQGGNITCWPSIWDTNA